MDVEYASSDESDLDASSIPKRQKQFILPKFAEADTQLRDDALWVPNKARYATGDISDDDDNDAGTDDEGLPNFSEFDVVNFGSNDEEGEDEDTAYESGTRLGQAAKQIAVLEKEEEQFKLYRTNGGRGYNTGMDEYSKAATVEGVQSQLKWCSNLVQLRGELQPMLALLQEELPTASQQQVVPQQRRVHHSNNSTGGIHSDTGISTEVSGCVVDGMESNLPAPVALPVGLRDSSRKLFATFINLQEMCRSTSAESLELNEKAQLAGDEGDCDDEANNRLEYKGDAS
eukprot:Lankesteria_metandrocarpae@DN5362_c0_g2_i1.p1